MSRIHPRPALVFYTKLFMSLAAFLLGVSLFERTRTGKVDVSAGSLAVLAGCAALGVLTFGWLGLGLPVRPAVWVLRLAGGPDGTQVLLAVHAALGALALVGIAAARGLRGMRHPWAPHLEVSAAVLWLIVWVMAMFGWV